MPPMGQRFNFHVLVMMMPTKSNDITIKILKQNAYIFLTTFLTFFNFCVNEGKFPNLLNPCKANVLIL